MHKEENISNSFAKVLLFYERYKRSNLNTKSLIKIAKKYETKPLQLINDLNKKYPSLKIPLYVTYTDLFRLCESYSIPDIYIDLIPQYKNIKLNLGIYNPVYDLNKPEFNSDLVLSNKYIIASNINISPLDNLSKCKSLLPGILYIIYLKILLLIIMNYYQLGYKNSSSSLSINDNNNALNIIQNSNLLIEKDKKNNQCSSINFTHFFENIADTSTLPMKVTNNDGKEIINDSPLQLLYDCKILYIKYIKYLI